MLRIDESFFVKLLTFLLCVVLGAWAGFKSLTVITDLEYSGKFVQWQLLESQQKFLQIVDTSEGGVWAMAENRKTYVYQSVFCDYEICGQWMQSTPPSEIDRLSEQLLRSGCASSYRYYGKEFHKYRAKIPAANGGQPAGVYRSRVA